MARQYTRVQYFDGAIDGMFKPGGLVWRYYSELSEKVREEAYFTAPVGEPWHGHTYAPGNLAKNLKTRAERRVKRREVVFYVVAAVPYATYVTQGTGPVIYGINGPMWVPLPPTTLRFNRGSRRNQPRDRLYERSREMQAERRVSSGGGYRVWMSMVKGQDANLFLLNAMRLVVDTQAQVFSPRFRRKYNVSTKRKYPFP